MEASRNDILAFPEIPPDVGIGLPKSDDERLDQLLAALKDRGFSLKKLAATPGERLRFIIEEFADGTFIHTAIILFDPDSSHDANRAYLMMVNVATMYNPRFKAAVTVPSTRFRKGGQQESPHHRKAKDAFVAAFQSLLR